MQSPPKGHNCGFTYVLIDSTQINHKNWNQFFPIHIPTDKCGRYFESRAFLTKPALNNPRIRCFQLDLNRKKGVATVVESHISNKVWLYGRGKLISHWNHIKGNFWNRWTCADDPSWHIYPVSPAFTHHTCSCFSWLFCLFSCKNARGPWMEVLFSFLMWQTKIKTWKEFKQLLLVTQNNQFLNRFKLVCNFTFLHNRETICASIPEHVLARIWGASSGGRIHHQGFLFVVLLQESNRYISREEQYYNDYSLCLKKKQI